METSKLDKAKERAALMLDITGRKISKTESKPIIASGDFEEAIAVPVGELFALPENEMLMDGLSPDRLEALTASIKKNGIRTPLIVDQGKVVVCGNNRLSIARSLGLKTVPVIYRQIATNERADYARRDNLERRQLTREQLTRALEPILEEARSEVAEEKRSAKAEGKTVATGGVYARAATKAKKTGIEIKPATLKTLIRRKAIKTKPKALRFNETLSWKLPFPILDKASLKVTFFLPDLETFDKWKSQAGKLHTEWQNKINRNAATKNK